MKNWRVLIILIFCSLASVAQKVAPLVIQGNQYFRIGRYDLAEDCYQRALEAKPNDSVARYNLAIAMHKQQRFQDGITTVTPLTTSLTAGQLKEAAYYNQGVGETRQRNLEASIEAYKNALRIFPDDVWARENLQKALLELKQRSGGGGSQQNKGGMSQQQAQNELKKLEQKEQQLQEKMQKNRKETGSGGAQDW